MDSSGLKELMCFFLLETVSHLYVGNPSCSPELHQCCRRHFKMDLPGMVEAAFFSLSVVTRKWVCNFFPIFFFFFSLCGVTLRRWFERLAFLHLRSLLRRGCLLGVIRTTTQQLEGLASIFYNKNKEQQKQLICPSNILIDFHFLVSLFLLHITIPILIF